jgi:ABC-type multidrug transport system fused ATPase/permease subunit
MALSSRKPLLSPELRWYLSLAAPLKLRYLLQVLATAVASAAGPAQSLVWIWLVDDILPLGRVEPVALCASVFFLLFLLEYGANGLRQMQDVVSSQLFALRLRQRLLGHLQDLSVDYQLRLPPSDVQFRVEQDVERISDLGGRIVNAVVRFVVTTGLLLAFMVQINWMLSLLVILQIPVIVKLRRICQPRLRRATDAVQAAGEKRSSFLQQHLGSLMLVHLLQRGRRDRRHYLRLQREVLKRSVEWNREELLFFLVAQVALMAAATMVLGVGGSQVVNGRLTVGELVGFFSLVFRVLEPVETVVGLSSTILRAGASIRRLQAVLEEKPAIRSPPSPRQIAHRGAAGLRVQDVWFGYEPAEPVLRGLNLRVDAGERVAIVGASGCGKSTLSQLLVRFFDPQRGRIELDEVPLSELDVGALRRRVVLVPQTSILFDTSLRDNLTPERPARARVSPMGADEQSLLDVVQLRELVASLPAGLDTEVKLGGSNFSGGERQRFALARALAREPRLLILDETTSSLDGRTERDLLDAIDRFLGRRVTVLVISHRLPTVLWADRVIVLSDGRHLAEGSHEELCNRCREYREIWARAETHESADALAVPT